MYCAYTETYSTGDLYLLIDHFSKIFEAQFLNKLVTLDLSKETLCKYQQKNPRAENLDRYM